MSGFAGRNDDVAAGTDFGITNQPAPLPEPPVPPATPPVPNTTGQSPAAVPIGPTTANPDDVSILVGSTVRISGWSALAITLSCEAVPNHFSLTAAEAYPYDPSRIIALPGKNEQVQIYIGNDLVITGWIDRYDVQTAATTHTVTISGRGLCQDIVDCSADLINNPAVVGGQIRATDVVDLAKKLCTKLPIQVAVIGDSVGPPLPRAFQVSAGETAYEIIERAAGYVGFLTYENEFGTLLFSTVGALSMASGFTEPGNIESATSMLSVDQRFSDYTVIWSTVDTTQDISNLGFQRAHVTDATMTRYRPRIIVSAQMTADVQLATKRANWEMARRIGRSQAINVTVGHWRDIQGSLWRPNYLAPVTTIPHKLVNQQWIIGTVTFRKDDSGTHADLTLMPPDAFNPQPDPLQLWDREVTQAIPASQTPAPASTGGAPGPLQGSAGSGAFTATPLPPAT